jgi:phosphoenolpyruvate carboxykinase (ATP)
MKNMLINPTKEELDNFGDPDFTVYNAGCQLANTYPSDVTSSTSINFDFKDREIVILGTQYAGEMKKGIFTVMHYLMPKQNILSLHSSCNTSLDISDVALFFGLSGTGKTTLSADPQRLLVGDDEHCWYDDGVFNIEGGCYAKCVDLKKDTEPDIWNAIRFGNVVENIKCYPGTKVINFSDISITENTRAAYPIEHTNAIIPCVSDHPNNIIFLCCDAFGVIPTVSLLTIKQAMYYFISGYTAMIPGTVMGITEPIPTFSACFGDAFITCHPKVYAQILAEKLHKHKSNVWLINTGWIRGKYGTEGAMRCPLKYTRMIVNLIHKGELALQETKQSDIFNLMYFNKINGIPEEVLDPVVAWHNNAEYKLTLEYLKQKFDNNMEKLTDGSEFMKNINIHE